MTVSRSMYNTLPDKPAPGENNTILFHQPFQQDVAGSALMTTRGWTPTASSVKQTNSKGVFKCRRTPLSRRFTYSGPYLVPHFTQATVMKPPARGEGVMKPPARGEGVMKPPARGEGGMKPPARGEGFLVSDSIPPAPPSSSCVSWLNPLLLSTTSCTTNNRTSTGKKPLRSWGGIAAASPEDNEPKMHFRHSATASDCFPCS